jgi:hypothetical protein
MLPENGKIFPANETDRKWDCPQMGLLAIETTPEPEGSTSITPEPIFRHGPKQLPPSRSLRKIHHNAVVRSPELSKWT